MHEANQQQNVPEKKCDAHVIGAMRWWSMHGGVGGLQNRPESSALLHEVRSKAGAAGEGLCQLALCDLGGKHPPLHHLLNSRNTFGWLLGVLVRCLGTGTQCSAAMVY